MAEETKRRLTELRGLLERIEKQRLEPGDWDLVDELLGEVIEEAEATGQESLFVGPEEDEASGGKIGEAVGAEDPTPEGESKEGARFESTPVDPKR